MIGYFLRVEVERLVHHPVEIRHTVVGLHRERLRELEAHLLQRGQVRRLELGDDRSRRVVEDRLWSGIDARRVEHEVAIRLRHDCRVRGVTRGQELHARAVETDAIEVGVVRVLTFLTAGGRDVGDAQLVVDALERRRDELAVGDPVLETPRWRHRRDSSGPTHHAPTRRRARCHCWRGAEALIRCRC